MITPQLQEQFEQKEARVESPTYHLQPAEMLQQQQSTAETEVKQPFLTQLPVLRKEMEGKLSEAVTASSVSTDKQAREQKRERRRRSRAAERREVKQ